MTKGQRKKGQSDLLNKLVSDCMTFRLNESEALTYIEKSFGESISKRAYWNRRAKLRNSDFLNGWMDWFTRIGFVQSHRRQIDDIEKINQDSLHRLYELTHHKDWMGKEVKPTNSDGFLILKLKEDIRANIKLLAELALGTPVITAIKKRIEDAYKLQTGNDNNENYNPKTCRRKSTMDWYSE